MREFTSTQAEDLYELICGRYRAGSMMVTSNRPPADWYTLFPNPVLAESALDRLVNSAHHVIFRGRTYRPLRRPDRDPNGAVNVVDDLEAQHPGRSFQKRAREKPQDARDDDDTTADTSDDDGNNAPTQRRT